MNPFFETWKPDPVGLILGTGMMRFTAVNGMHGLARLRDGETKLDLLAIGATEKGAGNFRSFIARAKLAFREIVVMHDDNPIVGRALKRYGFKRIEKIPAWEWRNNTVNRTP